MCKIVLILSEILKLWVCRELLQTKLYFPFNLSLKHPHLTCHSLFDEYN